MHQLVWMFVSQPSGVLIPRQRGLHDLETSSLVPRQLPDLSGSHHYWINSGNEPKKREDLGLSYPKYSCGKPCSRPGNEV